MILNHRLSVTPFYSLRGGVVLLNSTLLYRGIVLTLMFLQAYVLVCVPAVRGFWLLTLITTILIAVAVPVFATYLHRRRPPWSVLNPRKQSWAFMFGDPFCLAPAMAFSAVAWKKGLVPDFALSPWWKVSMLVVGIAAGYGLCRADRKRYEENDALEALNKPDKLIHDWVVVPTLFCSLLTTAVPLLAKPSVYTAIVVAFVAIWGILLYIDDKKRLVDPHWQYDLLSP